MSATTELLTEKVNQIELEIQVAREKADQIEVERLTVERNKIQSQLLSASKQLQEGAQLLKG